MTTYLASPHMTRFRCIGTDCEDTCCRAWDVPISDDDQARLAAAIGEEATAGMVTKIPNGRGGTLVVLNKLPDRSCTQLDDALLCKLHAKLGEDVLPEVCASFPRNIGRVGDRLELTGQLSCPEVMRLCLLGEDGPALMESPREPFGREKVRMEVSATSEQPYLAGFVTVRDALMALCTQQTFSVASRLYFIAELAHKIAPFYSRESTTAEPEKLADALALIRDRELQAALHQKRGASSPMDGLALQAVFGMMHSRIDAAPAFAKVVAHAARTHGKAVGLVGTGDPLKLLMEIGPERLWRTHMERRQRLGPAQTARLDEYLERYCREFWLQDWYPLSPTLLEHLMHLVLRVALVRFLVLAHPDFGPGGDAATTDRAAVEVFYAVSRAYDHNARVREALSQTLHRQGMVTVDHAAALLKL